MSAVLNDVVRMVLAPVFAPVVLVLVLRYGGDQKSDMLRCMFVPMLLAPLYVPCMYVIYGYRAWQRWRVRARCPICLERMVQAIFLDCGHVFHETCIRSWLDESMSCPICRRDPSERLGKWAQALLGPSK